jgi:hypothetical protein
MTKSPDYGVKGLRNSTDYTTSHTFGQDLILIAGTDLFCRLFASQMALPGFAKFNFPRTGYLKSFGYSFVRLLHFMEKRSPYLFEQKQASQIRLKCCKLANPDSFDRQTTPQR